jgi:RING-type zinc-finger/MYND finger
MCDTKTIAPGLNHEESNNDNGSSNVIDVAECIKLLSRDGLTCDGPSCFIRNPRHRCSQCRCRYYCSKTCQKLDWKSHKEYCISIETAHSMNNADAASTRKDMDTVKRSLLLYSPNQPIEDNDDECGICFERPMLNPTTLKECKHTFCSSCLLQWQQSSSSNNREDVQVENNPETRTVLRCPICRTETDQDIVNFML